MNKLHLRPCKRCGELFKTLAKGGKICPNCKLNKSQNLKLKEKYFLNRDEIKCLIHEETLKKWKILSESYKLGKQIWGNNFSVKKLSEDFELPYTTVKRCLSLDKATSNTWKLIKSGKLSAFKAAQVCMAKNNKFQDETIKTIIENDYSTYKIKSFKINDEKDLVQLKTQMAVENGFSRKESAYRGLHTWIERGKTLLIIKPEYLPENRLPKLKKELNYLKNKIKLFTDEI